MGEDVAFIDGNRQPIRLVVSAHSQLTGAAYSARLHPFLSREAIEEIGWMKSGGEGGIRTPETLSSLHAFQACALNRARPPLRAVMPVWHHGH